MTRVLLAILLLSQVGQSQQVGLPRNQDAECGVVRRSDGSTVTVCDFEYWLKSHDPAQIPTESGGGPTLQEGEPGGMVLDGGGYSIVSHYQAPEGMQLVGGTVAGSISIEVAHAAWSFERYRQFNGGALPGFKGDYRGSSESVRVNNLIAQWDSRLQKENDNKNRLSKAQKNYQTLTMTPALAETLSAGLELASHIERTLAPFKSVEFEVAETPFEGTTGLASAELSSSVSNLLSRLGSIGYEKAPTWNDLENLQQLPSINSEEFSLNDQVAIRQAYDTYFDSNGVLLPSVLPASASELSTGLSNLIESSPNTPEGSHARRLVNRGLYIVSGPGFTDEQREEALGGMLFTVASDFAFNENDKKVAAWMRQRTNAVYDKIFGYIPFVSTANDALQILHGAATGEDLQGKPMRAGDYVSRAATALIGIPKVAGFVFRIAGNAVKAPFFMGCDAVRRMGLHQPILKAVGGSKQLFLSSVEAIGNRILTQRERFFVKELDDLGLALIEAETYRGKVSERAFRDIGALVKYDYRAFDYLKKYRPSALDSSLKNAPKIVPKDTPGWGTTLAPGRWDDHFTSHMNPSKPRDFLSRGYEFQTKEHYLSGLRKFMKLETLEKAIRKMDGAHLFFDRKTGQFAAVAPDGVVKTYFIPDHPAEYWATEILR